MIKVRNSDFGVYSLRPSVPVDGIQGIFLVC